MEEYSLKENEKDLIYSLFIGISSPYISYNEFHKSIRSIYQEVSKLEITDFFKHIKKSRESGEELCFLIKNCPLDKDVPIFDYKNPLEYKYLVKKTFVSEAFLELFSQVADNPILAYETRNNCDFFHDVYFYEKYKQTQTQKTDGELYQHNDRTAHPIRADYLNLLGMRCSDENKIITSYVDGKDILNLISDKNKEILRKSIFVTPYDEYSRDSNKNQNISYPHPILSEEHSIRYYETRTIPKQGSSEEVFNAYIEFRNAIIKSKKISVNIQQGDLFTFPNQFGLHSRNLIEIRNKEASKSRWLLKTYTFRNKNYADRFFEYFDKDCLGCLVLDSLVKKEL